MTSFAQKWLMPYAPVNATAAPTDALANWVALWEDFDSHMIAAGMVQSGDVGQLDFSTLASIGTVNTDLGYKIYAFDDALQSTMPIYVKVVFCNQQIGGNAPYPAYPVMKVSVGSATDGAGNLTTTLMSVSYPTVQNISGTVTPKPSSPCAICYNETVGFFGYVYGNGLWNYDQTQFYLFIQRDVDNFGVPVDTGYTVYSPSSTLPVAYNVPSSMYSWYYSPGFTAGPATNWAARIGGVTNTSGDGNTFLQNSWTMTPAVKPVPSLMTYSQSDIPSMTEITIDDEVVGARNYLCLGSNRTAYPESTTTSNSAFAMLFE